MALPELTKQRVEKVLGEYCAKKVPAELSGQVRMGYRIRGNNVTLYEEKPHFLKPDTWVDIVVAQFRYDAKEKDWTLYCADRNSRWHEYFDLEPDHDFKVLLKEVDEDPTGIFFG